MHCVIVWQSMQFDLLPLTVRQNEHINSYTKQSRNLIDVYFRDQNLRLHEEAHSNKNESISAKKKKKEKSQNIF